MVLVLALMRRMQGAVDDNVDWNGRIIKAAIILDVVHTSALAFKNVYFFYCPHLKDKKQ